MPQHRTQDLFRPLPAVEDVYGQRVDRSTISRITDGIVGDMEAWQLRPLDSIDPVLLVDGIRIKIRDGTVTNRVVYVVMGINMDSERSWFILENGPFSRGDAWSLDTLKGPPPLAKSRIRC